MLARTDQPCAPLAPDRGRVKALRPGGGDAAVSEEIEAGMRRAGQEPPPPP